MPPAPPTARFSRWPSGNHGCAAWGPRWLRWSFQPAAVPPAWRTPGTPAATACVPLELERLTQDHSLVEEQVRLGQMTAEEARRSHLRNVITRVVGSNAQVEPEVALHTAQAGDIFLLCSDGLTRDLSDGDLRSILNRHRRNLAHTARVLVDAANLLGGGDNITVLLVGVEDAPAVAAR